MNATPTFSSCPLKDHGTGWGAFARWLSLAVLVVLAGLALSFLGAWVRHQLVRTDMTLLTEVGAQSAFAALSACGMVLPWHYFSRVKHSAKWLARIWLYCFSLMLLSSSQRFPWWLQLAGIIVSLAFLAWAYRAWGRDWLERDDFTEKGTR
jgi:hypothetical protein